MNFGSLLAYVVQFYLPPDQFVTKDWLKQILAEKKALFRMNDVRHINIPLYDELSVKNLWP